MTSVVMRTNKNWILPRWCSTRCQSCGVYLHLVTSSVARCAVTQSQVARCLCVTNLLVSGFESFPVLVERWRLRGRWERLLLEVRGWQAKLGGRRDRWTSPTQSRQSKRRRNIWKIKEHYDWPDKKWWQEIFKLCIPIFYFSNYFKDCMILSHLFVTH